MFSSPADRAARKALPRHPLVRQNVRTGSSAAAAAEMLPPDDCITRRFGHGLLVSGDRYHERLQIGMMVTVEVRSYSRYSGRIW